MNIEKSLTSLRKELRACGANAERAMRVISRVRLIVRDEFGEGDARPPVEEVLRGVIEAEALDDGHLHAHAAQAAARELIASWMDVVNDSSERDLTTMMLVDIDETVDNLLAWRRLLQPKSARAKWTFDGGAR